MTGSESGVEHHYAIAASEVIAEDDESEVVLLLYEFGFAQPQPHPGRKWAKRRGRHKDPDREPTDALGAGAPHRVRLLFAAHDLDKAPLPYLRQ